MRHVIPILCALALLLPLAVTPALAQNETANTTTTTTPAQNTTTTQTNTTVWLPSAPSITPISRGEATVSAYYINGSVVIYYTCFYLGSPSLCPKAYYRLETMNGTVLKEAAYQVDPQHDCSSNMCKYRIMLSVQGNYTQVRLVYTLEYSDGTKKTYTIILSEQKPAATLADMIPALLPLAVTVGLAIQYNLAVAGVGAIASVVVVYLLSVAGVCSFNPLIANLAIAAGAILIYFSRR